MPTFKIDFWVMWKKVYSLSVVLFFLIFSQFGCKPSTPLPEERVERFETGQISRIATLIDGKLEGRMTDFYPDGKKMAERWFKKGQQDGRTLIFYPSGQIKEVQYYMQGQQHGGDTILYENGKIQFTVFFQNNTKNGFLRKWSQEGALVFESKYSMDTLIEVKGEPISRESINMRQNSDTIIKPQIQ